MSKLKTDVDYFFLHPGSIVITGNKIPVMTILGSCIALVAFSSKHKVGCVPCSAARACRKNKNN